MGPSHRNACIDQRGLGLISFSRVTVGSLTDNVLLDIFDFCQMPSDDSPRWWHALVHVCRRWRYIVFESPLRLHLELVCNANTRENTLDVWPQAFPIVIKESRKKILLLGGANLIPALEQHDRVSEIDFYNIIVPLKLLNEVMKKPYPVLTRLRLHAWNIDAPTLHDTFLGGSAPRLKYIDLFGIPFPALPKLLPSCHDLIDLRLDNIPHTGYISPEAITTALSALTKLTFVYVGFKSSASRPDPGNSLPSSLTRVVLPALTRLEFRGASEYFEDLVARIDTPAIIYVDTGFFNQLDFVIPHFVQYIGRTRIPGSFDETRLCLFDCCTVRVVCGRRYPPRGMTFRIALSIEMSCQALDRQIACVAQICGRISPFLSNLEQLQISRPSHDVVPSNWKGYMDNPKWLQIFQAFPASQHVYIPLALGETIASALQELTGERVMEALPMLRHLYLPYRSEATELALQPFISSRQRSNHPVTIHYIEFF